ncbi:hypothetical protein ACG74X_13170 [Marivita sp. S0852]|uniref:hypothetical protein n=1 Tax=Marivita sp. S0852 TaxID=3373893 RepID=UPI003981B687
MKNALTVLAICMASPGSADLLADLAPPPPSDGACWERTYDDAHLARHPRQKVTDIRFHLQNIAGEYAFNIAIATRERAGQLHGYCSLDPDGSVACLVACDGGEIYLRRSRIKGAILLAVDSLDRLHVNAKCKGKDNDGAEAFMIQAEPDDRLFLLHATSVRTCTVQPFKPFLDHRGK